MIEINKRFPPASGARESAHANLVQVPATSDASTYRGLVQSKAHLPNLCLFISYAVPSGPMPSLQVLCHPLRSYAILSGPSPDIEDSLWQSRPPLRPPRSPFHPGHILKSRPNSFSFPPPAPAEDRGATLRPHRSAMHRPRSRGPHHGPTRSCDTPPLAESAHLLCSSACSLGRAKGNFRCYRDPRTSRLASFHHHGWRRHWKRA